MRIWLVSNLNISGLHAVTGEPLLGELTPPMGLLCLASSLSITIIAFRSFRPMLASHASLLGSYILSGASFLLSAGLPWRFFRDATEVNAVEVAL